MSFKNILLNVILLLGIQSILNAQKQYSKVCFLMGTRFEFIISAEDSMFAYNQIKNAENEVKRIEKLISSWKDNSETALINKNAGIKPVKVSDELFGIIKRALFISKLTEGAFDITYAAADAVWKFNNKEVVFPDSLTVKNMLSKIGYKKVIIDEKNKTVFLSEKGMKIGFGAIGKGYSADKVKKMLIENGVKSGIVDAGGDIITWGKQPNGKDWTIAVKNPMNKNKVFAVLPVSNKAVVTSGDYEKFFIYENKKYTHIINPKTGYPTSGLISVTIFAESAELADALATGVFILGRDTGLNLINQIPEAESVIIDESGKMFTSNKIDIKKYEENNN